MQILLLSKDESIGSVLLKFIQEFFAGLLLFFLFSPKYVLIGAKLTIVDDCIVHFLFVILFDIITCGACANPSIFLGMFVAKEISLLSALAGTMGNFVAASIGFLLLDWTLPTVLTIHLNGPYLYGGLDVHSGCIIEGLFSFCFMAITLYAIRFITNLTVVRSYYAIMIRVLIIFGSTTTGACFNPLIGFARFCYNYKIVHTLFVNTTSLRKGLDIIKKQWLIDVSMQDYFYVYVLSPFIGTCVAAILWTLIENNNKNNRKLLLKKKN